MTFTHEDIKNRLIEFLYGELPEEARLAFDAHVAACPSCRADVAAFQETRQVARAAVRAGLAEPVPAVVRARVLEAAAAAKLAREAAAPAGSNGQAAAAASAAATATKKLGRTEEAAGPFAWLRARWAIPMFATVAAMGMLLLVRETIFREAREPLRETAPHETASPAPPVASGAPVAPATGAPPAPTPTHGEAEPAEAALEGQRLGGAPAEWPASLPGPKEVRRPRPTAAAAPAKPARKPSADKGGDLSDSLDRLLSDDGARAGSARGGENATTAAKRQVSAKKREISDDVLSGFGRSGGDNPVADNDVLLGKATAGRNRDKADSNAGRGFAQPPPAAPAAPAAPVAPAAPAAPAARAARAAPAAAPAPTPTQTEAPSEERAAEPEAAAPTSAHVVSAAAEESDRAPPDPAASLAARAEKLMTSRQWSEAAAAYRTLIARYPKHEQVPNWKRRLAVVEAAAARSAPSGTGFATPPPSR